MFTAVPGGKFEPLTSMAVIRECGGRSFAADTSMVGALSVMAQSSNDRQTHLLPRHHCRYACRRTIAANFWPSARHLSAARVEGDDHLSGGRIDRGGWPPAGPNCHGSIRRTTYHGTLKVTRQIRHTWIVDRPLASAPERWDCACHYRPAHHAHDAGRVDQ